MRRRPVALKTQSRGMDKPLLFIVIALVLFGLLMILNVSVVEAQVTFGDKFFYAKRQAIWAVVGLVLMGVLSKIPFRVFEKVALPVFLFAVILLAAVLFPGVSDPILGAKRWIVFGPAVIQPSELAKLALVVYLSYALSKKSPLLPFLFAVGLVSGLVILEPDLGTALIIGSISLIMYFAAGMPILYLFWLLPAAVLAVLYLALTSEYRRARILTFLNPAQDPLGAGYHIRQILIALGSGGIFGVGLGQSRQKYLFLPESTTDSVFAIIGEEMGLLGTSVILAIFLFLLWRGFAIASRVNDSFGRLLAVGITAWIGVQAAINLSAMLALVPLTGVPLPFLSYGGSSLVAILSGVGILLNVSRYREKIK